MIIYAFLRGRRSHVAWSFPRPRRRSPGRLWISVAAFMAIGMAVVGRPATAQLFGLELAPRHGVADGAQHHDRRESRPLGRDIAFEGDVNAGIAACVRETSRRMSVLSRHVQTGAVEETRSSPSRPVYRIEWFLRDGQRGQCDFSSNVVVYWRAIPISPYADVSCVQSVAARIGKRPGDIDVIDIEGNRRHQAWVLWETYQGERGRCQVDRGLVKKVVFE